MRTGLVLGKFAPLHKGHQYLIERALAQVDRLYVMIYACPELIDVPLSRRAGWIRKLYPSVTVIEAPDGPLEIGDSPEIKKRHEDYILARLAGQKITHFFCSEFYGEHVSRALGAEDCRIDELRKTVPISATEIRKNYYAQRRWLPPCVYADLVKKVLFLGAPSTGKTTLAKALAERLHTEWMPEYGRTFWEENQVNRRLTPGQLVTIAEKHLELEDQCLLESNRFLFVDTSALTTYHFALDYHGSALPELERLAALSERRYDYVFLCGDDIPYEDTWDRSGEVRRAEFQQRLRQDLDRRGVIYKELTGDLETRANRVLEVIKNNDPWSSGETRTNDV